MITQFEARPPYVTFHMQTVEDRQATIENGYYTERAVPMAHITPPGSKDVIERNADDWIAQLREQARAGAVPMAWASEFAAVYDAWKKGEELPESGTPIKTWPVLSPAERSMVINANIRTVEDLAQATEQGLGLIGMNARSLQQKAQKWLEAAQGVGRVVQENEALRAEIDGLRVSLESAMEQIAKIRTAQGEPDVKGRRAA